jgi:hypothetical protein
LVFKRDKLSALEEEIRAYKPPALTDTKLSAPPDGFNPDDGGAADLLG